MDRQPQKQQSELLMTRQRRVILEEVCATKDHPRADQIYDRVRQRLPKVSMGTVYRTLDVLSEHGLIRKLESGGNRMRFDGRVEPHYHIRCRGCGRVVDLDPARFDCVNRPLDEDGGFKIQGHHLEFFGLCPDCRRAEGNSPDGAGQALKEGR